MVIRVSDKKRNYNNVTKLLVKPKEYYFRLGLAQDSKLFKSGLDELSNFVDEHLIS